MHYGHFSQTFADVRNEKHQNCTRATAPSSVEHDALTLPRFMVSVVFD